MLYEIQNDWNKNSKWLETKKTRQKICRWKGTKNLIIVPKMYYNAEYWRPARLMWMVQNYKQLESIYNLIHGLKKGTNRCNAKTGKFVHLWYKFHFNKNWIFVAIYGIQKSKTKTCFSQNFKSKNIVSKLKNVIMR